MKRILPFFIALLVLTACSKKDVKFELFSADAFAYSLDQGYELDANVIAKGFKINKTGELYAAKLNYTADIIMPDGTVKKGIASGIVKKEEKEEFAEIEISIQKELDASYKLGKYKVAFNVTDEFSGRQLRIEKEFELSK